MSWDRLWDGSEPLGSLDVVEHTVSTMVFRVGPETTKRGVLRFKNAVSPLANRPLHRLWRQMVSAEGVVLEDLAHMEAWRLKGLAEKLAIPFVWRSRDLGRFVARDYLGRVVPVPPEARGELLERMLAAGCEVGLTHVD